MIWLNKGRVLIFHTGHLPDVYFVQVLFPPPPKEGTRASRCPSARGQLPLSSKCSCCSVTLALYHWDQLECPSSTRKKTKQNKTRQYIRLLAKVNTCSCTWVLQLRLLTPPKKVSASHEKRRRSISLSWLGTPSKPLIPLIRTSNRMAF